MSRINKYLASAGAAVLLSVGALSISPEGTTLIQDHEGLELAAYYDVANVLTICYGSTRNVKPNSTETLEQCKTRLAEDIAVAERAVKRLVKVPLTQSQYDALVSFTFNLGSGNLSRSTLLKRVNAGECYAAGREFYRWVYAGGEKLRGLQRRRAAEAELWFQGCNLWH